MALIESGTQSRLRWSWSGVAGAPYYSSLVMDNDASSNDSEANMVDAMLTNIANYISNQVSWTIDTAHEQFDIETGAVVGSAVSDPQSGSGTGSEELLPRAAQILAVFHTGEFVNGRELRGRLFLPGIVELANGNGRVLEAVRADIEDTMSDYFFNGVFLNHETAVYSPTHRVSALVQSIHVNEEFAMLRSRRD